MRDSASMPSLSPDVVDRVLRACLGGDDETLSRHAAFMGGRCIPVTGLHTCPEWKLTLDGQPHAIKARGSMIGNDNASVGGAYRAGDSRARRLADDAGHRRRQSDERAAAPLSAHS
ncbi:MULTISPECIES: hypothetical protein [Burkholderia]|uniref:hypothetical protein n=1 Tax=Burkholderia sp. AU28863 TaxID=2015352 RepID=UPI0015C66263|nr:hypothetical protein [Burkholderia sp. AU28863]